MLLWLGQESEINTQKRRQDLLDDITEYDAIYETLCTIWCHLYSRI